MNTAYLEKISELSTRLEDSIQKDNNIEKKVVIVELKNACFDFNLDNVCDNSKVTSFNNLQCTENCEECIVHGKDYYKSNIINKYL